MTAAASPLSPLGPTLARMSGVVVLLYSAALVWASWTGGFLYDEQGRPLASDFISFWSAGKLTLDGDAVRAYDWAALHEIQTLAAGHSFSGQFPWSYPPHALLLVAPLAIVAYPWSHLVWMAFTAPLYGCAVRLVLPRPGVLLAAFAFPAAFWNFGIGQAGFLAAGLLGCALALLDRRPLLAGALIALLTYKPQLGLFIPVALIAAGHWRAIAAATVTTLALMIAATLFVGIGAWAALFATMSESNRLILTEGAADYAELISAFGVTRWLGGSLTAAWVVQGALVIALGVTIWRVWRSDCSADLKCALLACVTMMGSPYLFIYDLVPLAVAIAFLARAGCSDGERAAIGAACLLTLGGPLAAAPVAAFAAPIVAGVALRRIGLAQRSRPAPRTAPAI